MPSTTALRLLEFVIWVVAASGTVIVGSLVVGLVVGGNLNAGKHVLFVVGFLIFGAGSLLIQPSRPKPDFDDPRTEDGENTDAAMSGPNAETSQFGTVWERDFGTTSRRDRSGSDSAHRFEETIQQIGPLADHPLPFDQRISRPYKVFVTGLLVLAFSLAMEVAGVHV